MFGTKPPKINHGSAEVKLRVAIDAAISDALDSGVDRRQLADLLDGRADGLRVQDANLRPIM